MPTAQVNGTTLYYEDTGKGPPILFIHGTGGNGNSLWDEQVRRLSARFRCVTYDRRGNRRSPVSSTPGSIPVDADDAAALIRALDMAPCTVVGISWGGSIGVDMLRRHSRHVDKAVLGEPSLLALDPDGTSEAMQILKPKMDQAAARGGPRAAVDAFYDFFCESFWASLSDEQREPFRANYAGMFADLGSPPYAISKDDLVAMQTPCLILIGSDTPPLFSRIARTVADGIPNAVQATLQGSGHVVFSEKPDECAELIADFITHGQALSGATA